MSLMDFSKLPKFQKTPAQLLEIIPILKNIILTKNLGDEDMNKLADAMKPEKFKKDDILIRYGD
jgi:hypothetical protein